MVDVAPNHFAWSGTAASVDYSEFVPFNSADYFHSFCFISDYSNQDNVEDVCIPPPYSYNSAC